MRKRLEMSDIGIVTKRKVKKGILGGIVREHGEKETGIREAFNVNTQDLPRLKGHPALYDCSVVTSGAPYQYFIFPIDNNMYLVAFDGSYLCLYQIYPDGKYTFLFNISERMTEDVAREKVKCVVYCGLDYGDNRGRRAIIYPLGCAINIDESTGKPSGYLDLNAYCDYNLFHSAVMHDKRIFATDGEKVYASKVESVIEFLPASNKMGENDPFAATVPNDTMNPKPILGVTVYKQEVYYFCENSFGRVWGGGNPYRIESLSDVGTVDFDSVKVLDDTLYFLSKDGLMAYDGQKLRSVSRIAIDLPIEKGKAAVYRGQYYFYLGRSGEKTAYTYCPQNDSFGCLSLEEEDLKMFAKTKDSLYLLSRDPLGYGKIHRLLQDPAAFSFRTPLQRSEHFSCEKLMQVRLLADFGQEGGLNGSLYVYTQDGRREQYPLFSQVSTSGVRVLSRRVAAAAGVAFDLFVSVTEGVSVLGYEMIYEKED